MGSRKLHHEHVCFLCTVACRPRFSVHVLIIECIAAAVHACMLRTLELEPPQQGNHARLAGFASQGSDTVTSC